MRTSSPIIGREAELSSLSGALDDPACDGVVLVGVPGVGKTLLAREAARMARERRFLTWVVRSTSSATEIPFGALAPFFRMLGVHIDGARTMFEAVSEALATRSDARPVLVVDDAHLLDDASATLLDQLVDSGTVFAVLAVRQGMERSAAILDLWKDLRVQRVQVDALPDTHIRDIATWMLNDPVDAATLREVVDASSGNVMFLRELIQGAVESGALRQHYGLWRLEGSLAASARLRDLIEARLAGLSEEERKGLELVAIGEPFPLAVLEQLVSVETVERLEVRRLLEAGREAAEPEVRLAHPLYGEVVRATLPGVRRARLSRQLADGLEGRGQLHGADILRVAVWRLDGGGGTPDAIAAAARRAFRSEDYELAERLGRAGWERWQRTDAAFVLGEVLDLLGRADEADGILAAASEVVSSDKERTGLAIRRASLLFRAGRLADAEAVVAETLARVDDVSCRRELDAIQGDHLLLAGHVGRAIELDRPLLEGPMDAAFAQASLDVGTALALAGRTQEALDHTSAALAVRLDLDDASHLSRTGVYVVAHTMALAGAGRLAEASAMAEQAYEVALEQRAMDGQAWLGAVLAQTRLAEGRLRTAGTLFREVTSLFEQLRHPGVRWGLGGIALAAGQLGDQAMSRAAIDEIDRMDLPTVRLMDVGVLRGRAWASVAANDLVEARRTLWEAYELAQDWGQLAGAAEALHDLIRIGARGTAVKLLVELEKEVDGDLMVARAVYAHAAAAKDPAMAKEATERFEALGALLFAAESAALEHSFARDRQLSRQAAAAAAQSARLLEACEGARTPALSVSPSADPLSVREREVAQLASTGLTSREIAERLFVSKRTVDNHLQRIYTKLGVSGRRELAARITLASDEVPAAR